MENLLDDLAYYLEQQTVGTRGSTLFISGFAGAQDNQIALVETGGVEPYKDIPINRPTVQVLVRNTDYKTGLTKAYEVFRLLDKQNDRLVLKAGGVDVMQVNALQEPTYLGQDDNSRHLFTCNYVFMCR